MFCCCCFFNGIFFFISFRMWLFWLKSNLRQIYTPFGKSFLFKFHRTTLRFREEKITIKLKRQKKKIYWNTDSAIETIAFVCILTCTYTQTITCKSNLHWVNERYTVAADIGYQWNNQYWLPKQFVFASVFFPFPCIRMHLLRILYLVPSFFCTLLLPCSYTDCMF